MPGNQALPEEGKTPPMRPDDRQALDALMSYDSEPAEPIVFTAAPKDSLGRILSREDPRALTAHLLDVAPVNSKIVVTDVGAILATPDKQSVLPVTDPANSLPRESRLQKVGKQRFRLVYTGNDGREELEGKRVNMLIAEACHRMHQRSA